MNYNDLYKRVSWLVKQESESGPYSLGTIEDLIPIANAKIAALVMAYPDKFRGLYEHTVADVTGRIRVPLAVKVYAVKLGNKNWTVPMSYNSDFGTIFLVRENEIKINPAPALGSIVMFDCSLMPTPIVDETSPVDVQIDAYEVIAYQLSEEIFIRTNTTPSEAFYRSMASVVSLFANRQPTFAQQSVWGDTGVYFGR